MKLKGLTFKIIIALIVGIILGSIFNFYESTQVVSFIDKYILNVIGEIFLNLIFMLVVPVVFVSIVLGVIGIGGSKVIRWDRFKNNPILFMYNCFGYFFSNGPCFIN